MTHTEVYRRAAICVQRFVCIALAEYGVKTISVFGTRPATFSTATQKRGKTNLLAIFDALVYLTERLPELPELTTRPVQFVAVGSPHPPDRVARDRALARAWRMAWSALHRMERRSRASTDGKDSGHRVNLLFNYSGRASLERLLASASNPRALLPCDVGGVFAAELGGDVGLVVRTAGAMRMSDAPCHQFYDAHVVQIAHLFPEIQDEDIRRCLAPFFEYTGPTVGEE